MRALGRLSAGVLALAVLAGGVLVAGHLRSKPARPAMCLVGPADRGYYLELEQAANAATIAAVGRRAGLPNHAVTVALATALQESKLHNVGYGDRDSLGLFQQRPSQGWGRPAQVLTPSYAAARFYARLRQVRGWRSLPVSEAAQRVQRSADGTAYARWEDQARALARALTGEVAAGVTCQFADLPPGQQTRLQLAARAELGGRALQAGTGADGWAAAAWLVCKAATYGVVEISLQGRSWTPGSGTWRAAASAGPSLRYRLAPPQAA